VGPAPPYGFCSLRLGVSARELVLVAAAGGAGSFVLFVVEESFGMLEHWNTGIGGTGAPPAAHPSIIPFSPGIAGRSWGRLGQGGGRSPPYRLAAKRFRWAVLCPPSSALRPPSSVLSVLQSRRTLFFVLDFDSSVRNVLIHSTLQRFSLGRTFWLRPMGEARGRAGVIFGFFRAHLWVRVSIYGRR